MKPYGCRLATALLAAFFCTMAHSQTVTTVTTYVTETQDKRESTRFTLTEWLRIKERMKMMDVWLAMNSKPESRFEPEIFLGYAMRSGNFQFQGTHDPALAGVATTGTQSKLQLWLTNLVSSTTGIRTLNIDFGLEGLADSTDKLAASPSTATLVPGKRLTTQATANFRLFGKNIQDSYFVLKYGSYNTKDQASPAIMPTKPASGIVAGGELAVYLFKWLGAKGNLLAYGSNSSLTAAHAGGRYFDYQAFVEISLLRLMVGHYQESFTFQTNGADITTTDKGEMAGAEILF